MRFTLITGASRGIGASMAEYCASKGYNLLLVARTIDALGKIQIRLCEKYKVEVRVFCTDLTNKNSAEKIHDYCLSENIKINMLINNAGIGLYGKFHELSLEEQFYLIELNQHAIIRMVYQFLPMLRESDESYILNVASTACYQPIPYMAVYAATQAFIQSFTLALREELRRYNVHVSCLCPGPTSTDFFERAGLQKLPVNSNEIKMGPDEVAETAIEGMLDRDSEIVPGTSNTLGAYFSKLFPNKFVIKTVAGLFAPKL
ncbi:MAG: SDR family NAD(P)-dependent oxidoreductase [Cytophagaceae bacterium]